MAAPWSVNGGLPDIGMCNRISRPAVLYNCTQKTQKQPIKKIEIILDVFLRK